MAGILERHPYVKLGRLPARSDKRVPRFGLLLDKPALPPLKPTEDWTKGVTSWGMMLNDQLGDCAEASVGHAVQVWTANTGTEITVDDGSVRSLYSAVTGYKPGYPQTDQGTVLVDLLQYWVKNGFVGYGLSGFANVNFADSDEIKQAVALCGAVSFGVNLPTAAQNQDIWDVGPDLSGDYAPGSWGGHAIIAVKYDADYCYFITWGEIMRATWAWVNAYTDECYALAGAAWFAKDGTDPDGFDLKSLLTYMQALQ